jgi:hypothetical protein
MSPITDALKSLFLENGVTTRAHLNKWCDGSREKLYRAIHLRVPATWESLEAPEACVRAAYETMLHGYKHYKAPRTTNSAAAPAGILSIPTAPKIRERKARKTAHPASKAAAPVLIVKVLVEYKEAPIRLR